VRAVILSHLYRDPASRGKLRALAGLGVSVAVAIPGETAEADPGLRLMAVPGTGNPDDPAAFRWKARVIRAHLADFRPDVLQLEEEPWHPVAPQVISEAARLSIPVILFSQDLDRPRGFRARRRESACYRAARAGIGGHALAARRLQEHLPGRPVLELPQRGVTLPPAEERPIPETLTIGYVGRLLPDRGVDRLLRACATLLGRWHLVIAGTGPEQEALELLAERLGLASRVRWLGGVAPADLARLWGSLDCLVLPAAADTPGAERWAAILPEAMARGVIPVVMAGGVAEAMAGPAGRVAADDEALAVALQTLCAYPGDRPRLAAAARQRVLDHFVDAALARQTLAFWQRVLDSPSAASA
jgi:glycosyltransferase involved in cell wall biosynthesis